MLYSRAPGYRNESSILQVLSLMYICRRWEKSRLPYQLINCIISYCIKHVISVLIYTHCRSCIRNLLFVLCPNCHFKIISAEVISAIAQLINILTDTVQIYNMSTQIFTKITLGWFCLDKFTGYPVLLHLPTCYLLITTGMYILTYSIWLWLLLFCHDLWLQFVVHILTLYPF